MSFCEPGKWAGWREGVVVQHSLWDLNLAVQFSSYVTSGKVLTLSRGNEDGSHT